MSDDNYLSQFLEQEGTNESIEVESKPIWVDSSNNSEKAYDAIISLKKKKIEFIKRHGKKTDYETKRNYLIKKTEVAKLVGTKPQPLFYSKTTAYSPDLLDFFNSVNSDLERRKTDRLSSQKGRGLMQKNKTELVDALRAEKKSRETETVALLEHVYKRTIDSLPADVRKKLGLQ